MKLRKFIKGNNYYFQMLDDDRSIVLNSQAYSSKDARDNGVDSVKANIRNADRYERIEEDGNQYFILKAGNGQEIGRSRAFDSEAELNATLEYAQKGKPGKKAAVPSTTPVAEVSSPPQTDGGEAYGTDGKTDDYKPLNYYKTNGGNTENGFDSFSGDGEYYFSYRLEGEIYMISEGYKSDKSRDNGISSVERNMGNEDRYQIKQHPNGKFFFNLRAGNNQEIATSRWFDGEGEMNDIIRRLTSGSGSGSGQTTTQQDTAVAVADASQTDVVAEPKKKRKKRSTTKKPKAEKVYLAEGDYPHNNIKYQLFRSGNDKHYFTFRNSEGKTILLNSNVRGFDTQEQGQAKLDQVLKHGSNESNYEGKTTKNDKFYFYLKDDEGNNIAKSFFFNTEEDMQVAITSLLGPEGVSAGEATESTIVESAGLGIVGLSGSSVSEEAAAAKAAEAAEEAAAAKAAKAAEEASAAKASEEAAAAKASEEAAAVKASEEEAAAKAAEEAAAAKAAEAAEEAAAAKAAKAAEEASAAKASEEAAAAKASEEAAAAKASEEEAAAKAAEEAAAAKAAEEASAAKASEEAAAAKASEEEAAAKAAEEAAAAVAVEEENVIPGTESMEGSSQNVVENVELSAAAPNESSEDAVTGGGFKWWWIILLLLVLVLLFYFLR